MLAPSSSNRGDRKRGEAGRGGSPLVEPRGDRKRGEAGRGGSPLVEPRGAGMLVILPAPVRLAFVPWVSDDSTPESMPVDLRRRRRPPPTPVSPVW